MNGTSSTGSLSFSQAIAATQSLIVKISENQLNETEIKQHVCSILSTKNGGRGFFVAYLTSDIPLADAPSIGIVEGLKCSLDVSSELLTKNLAMSSAMIITHSRNNDSDNVEGSKKVYQRTSNLIHKIDSESVRQELQKLQTAIEKEEGEYQNFLARWDYDTEQKEVILKAIDSLA